MLGLLILWLVLCYVMAWIRFVGLFCMCSFVLTVVYALAGFLCCGLV